MKRQKPIHVFEYGKLKVGEHGFKENHLNALLNYNETHDFEYFNGIRNGIQFKQYVGIIQVDGLTIEILPKADNNDDELYWRENLVKMLHFCRKLKADPIDTANVKRHRNHLLEVYFEIYLNELESLIHKGLVKQYRKQSKNVRALRGKLEFAANIKYNLVHRERFYTTHQVYDTNHIIHQILYRALMVVEFFTKGSYLYNKTRRILLDFPDVKDIEIRESVFNRIIKDRKTEPYKNALDIAQMLLLNYSPDISSGREHMLALLFDMNKLWEEFVLRMLKKSSHVYKGVKIIGHDSKPFWGKNFLQPDIVLSQGNEIAIIDTKWKRPVHNIPSIGDLRQMYAYNRFWKSKKAMLLYPGDFDSQAFLPFRNHGDDEHYCKMHYLSVDKLFDESTYQKLIEELLN